MLLLKLHLYILLLLSSTTLIAQSMKNTKLYSTSKTLIIELESINNLELISASQENIFSIISEDLDDTNTPNIYVENGVVHIEVRPDLNNITGSEKNKYRAGQPLYPKHRIEIPINISTTILIEKGNFSTHNFKGNLDLHIKNYGVIDINEFTGLISIESFSGKINCTLLNAEIDVQTSKGIISSLLIDDRINQTKTSLKGVYIKSDNQLRIKTIDAIVNLKPIKTRK